MEEKADHDVTEQEYGEDGQVVEKLPFACFFAFVYLGGAYYHFVVAVFDMDSVPGYGDFFVAAACNGSDRFRPGDDRRTHFDEGFKKQIQVEKERRTS